MALNDGPSGLVSGGSGITEAFFSAVEEIARGESHVLYRARRYGRWYVLKALREELRGLPGPDGDTACDQSGANPLYEEWLYKEYSVGVSLDHPNIVRVESLEAVEPFGNCIVMEWVEGEPLAHMVRGLPARSEDMVRGLPARGEEMVRGQLARGEEMVRGQLARGEETPDGSPRTGCPRTIPQAGSLRTNIPQAGSLRTKEILNQVLDAVDYCHQHGVYHHDLKPSNIMVMPDGRVKLIDFGLSDGPQYAAFKQASGTLGFAAPEQEGGGQADHRTDIYALGRLTEMLFPHRYPLAVHKATRRDPARRPQSVVAFRKLLFPVWPLWAAGIVLLLALAAWTFVPSHKVFPVELASGQTVHMRELSRVRRTVEVVCPGLSRNNPWPDGYV